ncbi:hypothetical protein H6B15_06420 [Gemmiger formicilis]|uniref:hypothetical protein n=1 Tax=Gemmiger formicilis TaxID=745368 RepID=UPI00195DB738|nr:hypothetical protein [Gemmiger formicilis]MBM6716292.1 hypothetical protein [Gemmiger formicilis]
MLFLVLVLLSSSVLSIVLKYLNTSSPYSVYFVNYITCALLAFVSMEPKTLYQGDFTPCWLGALTELPAFLVYPFYSVGVILIISVVSFFLFHERLNRRQMGAAGMILGALVLLNL